jgi:hypothetical protein
MSISTRLALLVVVSCGAFASACGNPLYSPCNGQADCAEPLRCIDLGNEQRICTKPCTTTKKRAGYPDGFGNDDLFVDGSSEQETVAEPQCADAEVTVSSEDNPDEGAQNVLVESDGVVGVCRVSAALLNDDAISGDSVLLGFCSPQ